jgi:hypothetical protein
MKSNSITKIIGARSLNLTVVNLNRPISNYHLGLIILNKIRKLKKLITNECNCLKKKRLDSKYKFSGELNLFTSEMICLTPLTVKKL